MLKKSLIAIGVAAAIPAVSFADITRPDELVAPHKDLPVITINGDVWVSPNDRGTTGNRSEISQQSSFNAAYVDQALDDGASSSLIYQGDYGSHLSVVDQDGTDAVSVILQTGLSQTAVVSTSNSGKTSTSNVFQQGGEYNYAIVDLDGSSNASTVLQDDSWGSVAYVDVIGVRNNSNVYQTGTSQTADVDIAYSEDNTVRVNQWGVDNTADVDILGGHVNIVDIEQNAAGCLLYTSPSPRDS